MTRFARWGFALALLPVAACSSNNPPPMTAMPASMTMPAVSEADTAFAVAAANSDMTEIQTSQMALQKARRPAVKQYAQMMIDEHQRSTQRLMGIAQGKGMVLPTALDAQHQQMVDQLGPVPAGPRFDREYLRGQVMAHQQTLATMQRYAANGTDPELKAFASDMAPVVANHLQMAQRLSGMRPARAGRAMRGSS